MRASDARGLVERVPNYGGGFRQDKNDHGTEKQPTY